MPLNETLEETLDDMMATAITILQPRNDWTAIALALVDTDITSAGLCGVLRGLSLAHSLSPDLQNLLTNVRRLTLGRQLRIHVLQDHHFAVILHNSIHLPFNFSDICDTCTSEDISEYTINLIESILNPIPIPAPVIPVAVDPVRERNNYELLMYLLSGIGRGTARAAWRPIHALLNLDTTLRGLMHLVRRLVTDPRGLGRDISHAALQAYEEDPVAFVTEVIWNALFFAYSLRSACLSSSVTESSLVTGAATSAVIPSSPAAAVGGGATATTAAAAAITNKLVVADGTARAAGVASHLSRSLQAADHGSRAANLASLPVGSILLPSTANISVPAMAAATAKSVVTSASIASLPTVGNMLPSIAVAIPTASSISHCGERRLTGVSDRLFDEMLLIGINQGNTQQSAVIRLALAKAHERKQQDTVQKPKKVYNMFEDPFVDYGEGVIIPKTKHHGIDLFSDSFVEYSTCAIMSESVIDLDRITDAGSVSVENKKSN